MSSSCTDSTNESYKVYWFDYFVSIGYIDSSEVTNIYAPYGKCTRSLLWMTYLINVIHFFLLSSGIVYILNIHRKQSGFCWPFLTWILSFSFLIAAIVLYVLLNWNITLFSILIIAFQLSTLIILWLSIFMVIIVTFVMQYRYQRCLLFLTIILLIVQVCCFTAEALITLHCLYNLKFYSVSFDYAYWSAIIAAAAAIVSTLLLDQIFIWCRDRQGNVSPRIHPSIVSQQTENECRSTSPIDSIILEDFHRQPEGALHYVYNNTGGTRRFRIQPTKKQATNAQLNMVQLRKISVTQSKHSSATSSDA